MRRPKRLETGKGNKSQSARFMETARALGCDEDEAAFKAKLAVIARQKPKDEIATPNSTAKSDKKT